MIVGESSRLQDVAKRLRYVIEAFMLVWEAAGRWTAGWFVLLLLQGLLPGATVYLTKILVDNIAAAVGAGFASQAAQDVLWPAVLMGAIMLLMELLGSLSQWVNTAQSELLKDHTHALIHERAMTIDLGFYETPAYYDLMERARAESVGRPLALLNNVGGVLRSSVTLCTVAAILLPYGAWLPLILVGSTLPALYVVVRHNEREHDWMEEHTPDRRRATYLDYLLTVDKTAPEVRLFGQGERYRRDYQAVRNKLRVGRLRLMREQTVARTAAGITALATMGATMAWMVFRVVHGQGSLGDLALFYQAFNQGQGLMRSLLSNAGQLYTNSLFLEHFFRFLKLERTVREVDHPRVLTKPVQGELEFEGVWFRYPKTDRYALKNFSLNVQAGKITAIVGANGAGKSTLLKLLCRFYDAEVGVIRIDGVDIRDLRLNALREQITVMFQDPFHYHASVAENIAMTEEPDVRRVEHAAKHAGAHHLVEKLPGGYDALLGKWFAGGTELSGGEWQRLTLARAFYRRAPVIVLDEPTSKMDSWAENEWYDRFAALAEGRTALLITHRFTTAMRADQIVVVDAGEVVEQGTHEVLLAADGRYATSWKKQMRQDEPHLATYASQATPTVT